MFGPLQLLSSSVLTPLTPPKDVPPPTPVNFPHYFPEITAPSPAAPAGASTSVDPVSEQPKQQKQSPPPPPSQQKKQRLKGKSHLTAILQGIVRPTEIGLEHFESLGVHIQQDASPTAVIPDYYNCVPDFATWDDISYDTARDINESTRRPMSNGELSPGIATYLDRRRELSVDNSAAYRTVRRMQPQPGQPPVRLGNAYDFYRHLENFAAYWDDTSMAPEPKKVKASAKPDRPASSAMTDAPDVSEAAKDDAAANDSAAAAASDDDGDSVSSISSNAVTTDSESKPSSPAKDGAATVPEIRFYRTNAGVHMPPEIRLNMITSFIKLITYDFRCNVFTPRMEPRLYLNAGTLSANEAEAQAAAAAAAADPSSKQQPTPAAPLRQRRPCSYFSSGCIFLCRSPLERDAARAGFVDGPLAAVSARHTTSFPSTADLASLSSRDADKDSNIDLARELLAALLTAQQRAREGRAERRIGLGEWWATKPRWGGGTGGPIGREVDAPPNTDEAIDARTAEGTGSGTNSSTGSSIGRSGKMLVGAGGGAEGEALRSGSLAAKRPRARETGTAAMLGANEGSGSSSISPTRLGGRGVPFNLMAGLTGMNTALAMERSATNKKPRKGFAIYDNYRMVRPPSSSWDRKTRYRAIGKTRGADYDDIFVISALFHHMSIVRVRVPSRLLAALDGDGAEGGAADKDLDRSADGLAWGRLEVVRSPWYDFFKAEDRLAAMRLTWAMAAFLTRKQDDIDSRSPDVPMRNAP